MSDEHHVSRKSLGYIVATFNNSGSLTIDSHGLAAEYSSFQSAWDDCRVLNGQEWDQRAGELGFDDGVLDAAKYLPYRILICDEPTDDVVEEALGFMVDFVPIDAPLGTVDCFWDQGRVYAHYDEADFVRRDFSIDHESDEMGAGDYVVVALVQPDYVAKQNALMQFV